MEKKNRIRLLAVLAAAVVVSAAVYFFYRSSFTDGSLTQAEARVIAERTCIKGGESLAPGYYNENSKTWWFDANLNATPTGCNPACVVSVATRQAEINWRCTGAVEPATTTPPIGEHADLIQVAFPQANQTVGSPIEISGKARGSWYFEANFPVTLYDAQRNIIAQVPMSAQGEWMTNDFVPFKGSISYQAFATTSATLVLENDNPSGLPENQKRVEIPLVLAPSPSASAETLVVRVYFANSNLDPEISCNKVFPVERKIAKTLAVASATMAQLLVGPTEGEKAMGYSTAINPGVKVRKLAIENGVAKIDFDKTIETGVGGSCRVTAIRSEIVETLKQFPTVKDVIISVDGRTEDILQP